ncbi:hypothetical protein LEP1GSC045_4283 [Leptospira interrogans serovar Pomona str. Kennewicki LC82-25]|nr:hypothetical protein LEP1GSC045_4283 [Leptospira interrogans serovar Pomona str. Kennewicki LC82-25]EKN96786.1 hypothetical protein LEP1GSC014_1320 [Leptospira interrogans serovar Pomona str. Pomona]EMF31927.1 hypothetical protein LEP1GSC201_3084 [Leptospira interrogans serovar Pomona str. Fox 32256]EMJ60620.1 hypothetical protein LEP1GSC197_3694 [Leptospira interrogans serovar Pomona str. CSL4002]
MNKKIEENYFSTTPLRFLFETINKVLMFRTQTVFYGKIFTAQIL